MLTLIVKPTESCNCNCAYCAVRNKEQKHERMTPQLLRTLLERVAEYLAAEPGREVNLTWHGGEPLLMGADFFLDAARQHREILGPNAPRLRHSMQSNLTLVTQEHVEALSQLGMESVGTSFDYIPGLRGLGKEPDAQLYSQQFFRGLELLRAGGIGAGAIYVVTSRSVARPVDTMVVLGNLFGKEQRGHFRINPLRPEGEAGQEANRDLAIGAEEFGHFLGRAYEYWYPRRGLLPGVAPFAAICAAMEGKPVRLCCEEMGECAATHLGISPTGEVFQCGRAMDSGALHYGSLAEKSLSALCEHPDKLELAQRSARLRASECAGCEIWKFCHGGCPIDAFLVDRQWQHRTGLCRSRQVFLCEYVLPLHERQRHLAPVGSGSEKQIPQGQGRRAVPC